MIAPARPKRVIHVTYGLDFGGVETHLTTIARARGKRYEHHFCALAGGGAAAEAIGAAGAPVAILGADPWGHPVSSFAKAAAHLRRASPDVVHGHGLEGNLFGMPAALLAGVRGRIAEEIGMPEHSAKAKIAMRGAYLAAKRVIAVSDAIRDAVIATGEAPAHKVVRLYNPVESPEHRAGARIIGEPLRIGFVGRLEPVKNPLGLVKAIALLSSEQQCRLLLIGEGSERPAIEAFIRSAGLQSNVELAGFQPSPAELLASCHLYVQPSVTEGFGIALIEAMACGLPAIATRSGGMPEIVKDAANGWLIASPDPRDIADAIGRAATMKPSQLAAIGEAARRSVEDRFDPAAYVRSLELLYDECVA
jgi:glycosyltransferase involved in cell wall biosynthesis